MASGECLLLDLETDNFILYNISANQSANLSVLSDEWFYPAFLYVFKYKGKKNSLHLPTFFFFLREELSLVLNTYKQRHVAYYS